VTKPETSGIDDLRQRLRSLGYLDAGVDRFVLAPACGARGAFAIALLASLRIGILGGLLLGPAAAVGVAAQLPGLVSGVRDGVLIATYMAVLFGAGIAGLALVAGLIVSLSARFAGSSLTRRGRLLSTAAGVAVAIACVLAKFPWWASLAFFAAWIPLEYQQMRNDRRAALTTAYENRAYLSAAVNLPDQAPGVRRQSCRIPMRRCCHS